ncbi:hypothetical protein V8C86DRAFT_3128896 [Haematococcus lacustris]
MREPRLLLRLDDGSLIGQGQLLGEPGSNRIIRISLERAVDIGRASDREVLRVQKLVDRIKQQFGVHGQALLQHAEPALKRPRQDFTAPSQPQAGVRQDWVMKALDVLQRVGVVLGLNKQLYWEPVDPKVLPSYYTVITRPIFIGQIQDRLNRGIYQAPSEFAADMRLHWANVKQFNPKHDPFHILGLKAEACFEEAWAQSGYGVERARRASAAMPTQKFETDRSDGQAKNKSSRTPTGRPSRGAARADAPISVERRNQMATFLSDLPDELSDHFASLLPKELLDGMTSGELELDFENLDEATLKRIDQWLREIRPDLVVEDGPASPTMVSNRSGVKVESYSDDDYVESDDDDDDE